MENNANVHIGEIFLCPLQCSLQNFIFFLTFKWNIPIQSLSLISHKKEKNNFDWAIMTIMFLI